MTREIRGTSPSGTLYARIINPSGLWWNGSTFESYSPGNYATYVVAMSEQGNSGVYVADFPALITTSGTYEYFIHRTTTTAAEGDIVVNTGKIDWTGSASVSASAGSMTGSEFYDYILRLGLKRTDKSTEVYEATTDAIQEMRRRFMFDEAEVDATSTDTIAALGDFKINIESNLGLLLGVTVEDGDNGTPLIKISKDEYDHLYPGVNVDSNRGFPKHYCVYAGQIYIGPIPDQTSFSYRVTYSQRAGTITSSTSGVPFTNLYRDVLADNVQSRVWYMLEENDRGAMYRNKFEESFFYATRRERFNSGVSNFVQKGFYL